MFKALKNTFNSVKNILSNKKVDNKSKNIESFVEDKKKIIKTNEKEINLRNNCLNNSELRRREATRKNIINTRKSNQ